LGYAIKLLAIARRSADGIEARVHPTLIPADELLARVDGALNAVQVEGDLTGRVLFQGAGAGSLPTTSAIMADVLDAARSIALGSRPSPWRYTANMAVTPLADLVSRHYIRLEVSDAPGVLALIAKSFGDNGVSIASVIQKETEEDASAAELVIVTHAAREADMQTSMSQIEGLEGDVRKIGALIRVED
jgi:homoserine dehydrogenase